MPPKLSQRDNRWKVNWVPFKRCSPCLFFFFFLTRLCVYCMYICSVCVCVRARARARAHAHTFDIFITSKWTLHSQAYRQWHQTINTESVLFSENNLNTNILWVESAGAALGGWWNRDISDSLAWNNQSGSLIVFVTSIKLRAFPGPQEILRLENGTCKPWDS